MVSGNRHGTIYEEDLEAGQKFHNGYERTKYEAEQIVRNAMRQLPITVIRPATIVGDTRTGEIDKLDGPYYLMVLIATNASGLRLPLLGRGDAPLHLVPIDYVIDAAWQVARRRRRRQDVPPRRSESADRARGVRGRRRARAHRGAARLDPAPARARRVAHAGLARLGRGPLAFLDMLDHAVHYDQTNTANALAGTTLRCPPLADYLPVLVRHVLEVTRKAAPLDHDERSIHSTKLYSTGSSSLAVFTRRPARSSSLYRNLRSSPAIRAAWDRLPPARCTRSVEVLALEPRDQRVLRLVERLVGLERDVSLAARRPSGAARTAAIENRRRDRRARPRA